MIYTIYYHSRRRNKWINKKKIPKKEENKIIILEKFN